jgi:hypothetical protein
MQYIQLQPQSPNDVPSANTGTMNLFINNTDVTLKDENGNLYVASGGGSPLDNLQLNVAWGTDFVFGISGETVHLLNISTNAADYIGENDEVWVYIERYRLKRHKKNLAEEAYISKAGWKHPIFPEPDTVNYPNRASEIQLTGSGITSGYHYFGQEQFFSHGNPPVSTQVSPSGSSRRFNLRKANVYLRFKLKIGNPTDGYTISKPLNSIAMMYDIDGLSGSHTINYKFT